MNDFEWQTGWSGSQCTTKKKYTQRLISLNGLLQVMTIRNPYNFINYYVYNNPYILLYHITLTYFLHYDIR